MVNCAGKNWRAYQTLLGGGDPRPRRHNYTPLIPGGACRCCGLPEHPHRGRIWRAAFWLGWVG